MPRNQGSQPKKGQSQPLPIPGKKSGTQKQDPILPLKNTEKENDKSKGQSEWGHDYAEKEAKQRQESYRTGTGVDPSKWGHDYAEEDAKKRKNAPAGQNKKSEGKPTKKDTEGLEESESDIIGFEPIDYNEGSLKHQKGPKSFTEKEDFEDPVITQSLEVQEKNKKEDNDIVTENQKEDKPTRQNKSKKKIV